METAGVETVKIQILLEEYKVCRKEIEARLAWQTQAVSMGTTIMVGFVAAMATLLSSHIWRQNYIWVLLVIPFYSSILGLLMVTEDEMIIDLASYENEILKPQLSLACRAPVLRWHEHKRERRFSSERTIQAKVSKWMVAPFPHTLFVIQSFLALGVLLYLRTLSNYAPFRRIDWAALTIDVLFLCYFIVSASLTAYSYRTE